MNHEDPITVLVVDDELAVREEMTDFDWESCGAVLVGSASNGREALEFCRDYRPDMVITDIVMPVMDGLTLLERLSKELPHTCIVLLTVHSEFDYVQEALRNGAIDYLVKLKWQEADIRSCVSKVRDTIDEKQMIDRKRKQEERDSLYEVLLNTKVNTSSKELCLSEFCNNLSIHRPYGVSLIKLDSEQSNDFFLNVLIDNFFHSIDEPVLLLNLGNRDYLLLYNSTDRSMLNTILMDGPLVEAIRVYIDRVFCIVFPESDDFRLVFTLFSDTVLRRTQFFYMRENMVETELIEYSSYTILDDIPEPSNNTVDEIRRYLIEVLVPYALEHRPTPEYLQVRILRILDAVSDDISRIDPLSRDHIYQCYTLYDLTEFTTTVLDEIVNRKRERPEISNAIEIIRRDYNKPIGLDYVASEVGLNPSYLSHLFPIETGHRFSEFLTNVRIEKAIELLENTNLKIYEVCEKVGIPNYKYFSGLFRKKTGKTPKDFQRGL